MIASSNALDLARRAAEAVGISVEELADLMVDGGVTALPPSDGITQRYSLEDLGLKLWTEMQEHPRSRRGEWFQGLLEPQQVAVIVVLRNRGYSSHVIAQDLGISPMWVARTFNKHADELGAQVVGLRLNTIAGQMQIIAEKAIEAEFEKGNGRAAWSIEKDRIGVLQSLGIVDQAVHKSEVTHRFDDATRLELDALVQLEQKKLAQKERIRVIENEEFDSPPAELDEDVEGT